MTLVEHIIEEWRQLPLQAQTEALDFIVFLRSRYQPSAVPEDRDEISHLLHHPLRITEARPLSREQTHER